MIWQYKNLNQTGFFVNKPNQSKKLPKVKRNWVKIALYTLLGSGALALCLVFTLYFALRSPSVMQSLLPKIKESLKTDANVDLHFDKLSVDLFRHVVLENVKVKWADGQKMSVVADAKDVQLRYSIWQLLHKTLKVEKIFIDQVQVQVSMKSSGKEKEEPSPPKEQEPSEEKDKSESDPLRDLLTSPPMTMYLKQIAIKDTSFMMDMEDDKQKITVQIHHFNFSSKINLEGGKLNLDIATDFAGEKDPVSQFKMFKESEEEGLEVSLLPRLDFNTQLSIALNPSAWQLSLSPLNLQLGIKDLILKQRDKDKSLELSLPNYVLDLKAGFTSDVTTEIIEGEDFINHLLFPMDTEIELDIKQDDLKVNLTDESGPTKIGLNTNLKIQILGQILHPDKVIESTLEKLSAVIELQDVEFNKGSQHLILPSKKLTIEGKTVEEFLNLDLDLDLKKLIFRPELNDATNLSLSKKISVNRTLTAADLDSLITLNDHPLLKLNLDLKNPAKVLDATLGLEIIEKQSLASLHKSLAILPQVGSFDVNVKTHLKYKHGLPTALKVDPKKAKDLPAEILLNLYVKQTEQPQSSVKKLVSLQEPISINLDADYHPDNITGQLSLKGAGIKSGPHKVGSIDLNLKGGFQKPLANFDLNLDGSKISTPSVPSVLNPLVSLAGKINLKDKHYLATLLTQLNGQKLLNLNLDVSDRPQNLQSKIKFKAYLHKNLVDLAKVDLRPMLGKLLVEEEIDIDVEHPWLTIEKFNDKELGKVKAQINLNTKVSQYYTPHSSPEFRVVLPATLNLDNSIVWNSKQANLKTELTVPDVQIPQARLKGLNLVLNSKARSGLKPKDMQVNLELRNRKVILKQDSPGGLNLTPLLSNLLIQLNAAVKNQDMLNLQKFYLNLNRGIVTIDMTADGSIKKKDFQTKGSILFNARKVNPLYKQITTAGEVEIPWNMIIQNGKMIDIDGGMQFVNLGFENYSMAIKDIAGSLTLREELQVIDKSKIKFRYLIDQNPFERVDYNRIRPLLKKGSGISVKEIRMKDKTVGPLFTQLFLQQNVLLGKVFDVELFGGSFSGTFYTNIHPATLQVGFLGRLSNLDPSKLLPDKFTGKKGKKSISARVALVVDVNNSLVSGRVDITKIGSDQLITLINILDPTFEDDGLNQARFGLKLAYPKYVGLKMGQGLLDMSIDLAGGLSKRIDVKGIPLTSMISAATGDVNQQLKEVPIQ